MQLKGKETEIIVSKRYENKGIQCDICNKHILPDDRRKNTNMYFKITTGHYDWGNDSVESIETQDVCCDCAPKFISEYLSKCKSTEYMNIETAHTYSFNLVT